MSGENKSPGITHTLHLIVGIRVRDTEKRVSVASQTGPHAHNANNKRADLAENLF